MLFATLSNASLGSVTDAELRYKLETGVCVLLNGERAGNTGSSQAVAVSAASHHLQAGGSHIRDHDALYAGLMLGLSECDALCLAVSAELLHNASLIQDDLQDRDDTRRGLSVVWKKFGPSVVICTGDSILSATYASLAGLSDSRKTPSLLAVVHERTRRAIQGQCEDLGASKNVTINLTEYTKIVIVKSGILLSLPLELVFVASGKVDWLAQVRNATEALTVAYQIADDLTDVLLDAESNSLNICLVLESREARKNALASAQALGNQYLDKAIALSRELPFDLGSVFYQLLFELRPNFTGGSGR
jgi:geranylgeranyl pyrophosphate synthase